MEVALVAGGRTTILRDLGEGTSMDAEWLALIHALTLARTMGAPDIVLIGDSADVVAKASGKVKCRGAAAEHCARFRTLAAEGAPPRIRHVKRSHNLAGIALARLHPR
jgi:ribonuclease HI